MVRLISSCQTVSSFRDSIYQQDGKYYYFGSFGEQYKDGYFVFDVPKEGTSETEAKFRYFSPTGEIGCWLDLCWWRIAITLIENGFQAKGTKYVTPDGKLYFFDKNSGNAYTNRWAEIDGIWYEFNDQAMHKLRRVNSTQQMAQHGSTVMQLVKM